MSASASKPLGFGMTVLLGAIAGFTIFLGLPIARARRASQQTIALLNALAIGICCISSSKSRTNAIRADRARRHAWHGGTRRISGC